MALHPKAKDRLLEELKRGLNALRVKHALFVDSFMAFLCFYQAQEVLPKTGRYRDALEEWVDDTPLTTFVANRLRELLRSWSKYDAENEKVPLKDIDGFSAIDDVASSLLDEFESLPWEYTLSTAFPDALPAFPAGVTTAQLDAKSRVGVCDLFFRESFPLNHDDEEVTNRVLKGSGGLAIFLPDAFDWTDNAAYFQVEAAGYIGPYGGEAPSDGANRALRRFVGLGLGLKLFAHEPKYTPIPKRRFWLIHKKAGDAWVIHERLDVDVEDSTILDGLKLWDAFSKEYPEHHKIPWLQGLVTRAASALSAPSSSTLGLAAEWFFDSFKGRDEALTYVRRMTCLEILLGEHGDTSKISLGELLGNRLAYLIGQSHTDRESVLKDFREIYGLRSRILHHGKHRFSKEERTKLWKLKSFCERALQEESKMLTADAKPPA